MVVVVVPLHFFCCRPTNPNRMEPNERQPAGGSFPTRKREAINRRMLSFPADADCLEDGAAVGAGRSRDFKINKS